jgi:hypothetical protein
VNSADGSCLYGGTLSGDFLNRIQLLENQGLKAVIQPVPIVPPSPGYHFTSWGLPFLAFWAIIYGAVSLLGFGIGLLFFFFCTDYVEHPPLEFTMDGNGQKYKIWVMILCPILLIRYLWRPWVAGIKSLSAKLAADKVMTAAKAEKDRLAHEAYQRAVNNPVGTELIAARSRLARLGGLPQTKERDAAIKDTQKLIAELETFPDQLSKEAGRLLALQALNENAAARDRPQALLAARKEIEES